MNLGKVKGQTHPLCIGGGTDDAPELMLPPYFFTPQVTNVKLWVFRIGSGLWGLDLGSFGTGNGTRTCSWDIRFRRHSINTIFCHVL